MSDFLEQISSRVLLCDGAMGTQIQSQNLDIDIDYLGQENCSEILNKSRPDLIREIHCKYLLAGADIIQTNSFGASPITLSEFDLSNEAKNLNKIAAELANEAIESFSNDGRKRFVLGSVGPGTKLPSLGQIKYQDLEEALKLQCEGLIQGGVDAILIETCQDPLQVKAAINGAKLACESISKNIPLIVQITMETTGTMLVGSEISAITTIVETLGIDILGMNCATGPREMTEHLRWISQRWPKHISVQPNAGLPELIDGQTVYPLVPEEMTKWMERFVKEFGVNLIGGCCGTEPLHIQALDNMLKGISEKPSYRPQPVKRSVHWVPGLASLYSQVEFRQENAYLSIGERCNANGSKKFRELLDSRDWDGCVAVGRDQEKDGSHTLDICTAFVGRNEVEDMSEVISRMRSSVQVPLVIDSTELQVLEAALKLYGGKAIVNSINFEDGEAPASDRLKLARKFGAAVIALTIDESGMAKDLERKKDVARRLYDFAVSKHGLSPSDLLFDPLTFTICTGNEDDRKLGLETLNAIEFLSKEMPECQIILGLSNISFGLNPPARNILNSVYLDHALKRGLTGAIVHVARIVPFHQIPEKERKVAEDLVFDRRKDGYDPLHAYLKLFEDRKTDKSLSKKLYKKIEDRLKHRIIDGDRQGLKEDLDEALLKYSPLDIINKYLLDGMKVVGQLFGEGKLQLPFVLQSAETMKASVSYLEPYMEKKSGPAKGTIVLATVRGDVHDIGKNLVDIILTNNGYKVVNLGIKQPIQSIIDSASEHNADAIGMSGLLVKSTVIMRENLEEMTRQGINKPVLLGGAALTRGYVEQDCSESYGSGDVAYAKDAFAGLKLMTDVVEGTFSDNIKKINSLRKGGDNKLKKKVKLLGEVRSEQRPVDIEEIRIKREELNSDVKVPSAPFFGSKHVENVSPKSLMHYLNETMLYQFHWGYRKQGRSKKEFDEWAVKNLRPILNRISEEALRDEIFSPQAIYGYWEAQAEGNDLILFERDSSFEAARFSLPRQGVEGGVCISDFVKDVKSKKRDLVALQLVTIGQKASDIPRKWFSDNRYEDYLYIHGLGVEITEALAEYIHARIRRELGFISEDASDIKSILRQGYRGSRYSFGYPACPNLRDQEKLLDLLGAHRIGIKLGEEDQLHPELSTSAIVLHHPQAKYFSV